MSISIKNYVEEIQRIKLFTLHSDLSVFSVKIVKRNISKKTMGCWLD